MENNNITIDLLDNSNNNNNKCFVLKLVNIYLFIIFVLSVLSNSFLLFIFLKNKNLRIPLNIFIIALTICNLFGALLEIPLVFISNMYCKWIFSDLACKLTATLMYFIGSSSIFLIVCISFERYYLMNNPLDFVNQQIKLTKIYSAILICLLLAFLWSILPWLGWSYYSYEGFETSCSVEWKDNSLNVISYNISIFLFVFLIPFAIILFTNLKLVILIKNMRQFNLKHSIINKNSNNNKSLRQKMKLESNLTRNIICLVIGFLITWLPYAFVSLTSMFIVIGPAVSTLPAMFAKSSILWSTLFYMFSNKNIKRILIQMIIQNSNREINNNKNNNKNELKIIFKHGFNKNGRMPVLL